MISVRHHPRLAALLAATGLALAGCGGTSADDGPDLSPLAAEGRDVVRSLGCQSCHSASGSAGVGPTWKGLAGTDVELDDGRIVIADTEYLRRAVADPGADRVAGFNAAMPTYDLSDGELEAVVAYIESLAAP